MTRIKSIFQAAPWASLILVGALLAAAAFGLKSCDKGRDFRDHLRDGKTPPAEVAPWMSPGFIGHAYKIERDIVIEALDAPKPPPKGPMSLAELAEYRGVPLSQVLDEAQAVVDQHSRLKSRDQ